MGLSVYLGSSIVPTPGDLDGFEQTIVRDFARRMIYTEAPGTVKFTGGAYRILRDAFEADFCASLPVRIYDDCTGINQLLFNGEVILADIKWNLSRCVAETSLLMGSMGARVLDGMKVVFTPTSDQSRRGQSIAPCATTFVIAFDPQNPLATTPREAYDWKEAMRHAMDFLSDGTIIVNNDWYDALPDDERIALVQGVVWRDALAQIDPISWSLDSLWMEIAKRYNVWMVSRLSPTGVESVSIVSHQSAYGTAGAISIPSIDGIVQSVDADSVYGSMKLGEDQEKNRTGTGYSALLYLRGLTHTAETYGAECPCARGDELSIEGQWVADHGVLEHVMWRDTSETKIDDSVCILQYTASSNAVTGSAYTFGDPLYNEQMLNYNVLARYSSLCNIILASEPSPSVLALNTASMIGDQAFQTGSTLVWHDEGQYRIGPFDAVLVSPNSLGLYTRWPADMPPLGSDAGNQWSISEYTSLSTGYKRVSWRFGGSVLALNSMLMPAPSNMWRTRFTIKHYNALNVLLQTLDISSQPIANGAMFDYVGETALFMNAGEYFTIRATHEAVRFMSDATGVPFMYLLSVLSPRYVSVTSFGLPLGAEGIRNLLISSFNRHISASQWARLLEAPEQSILMDGAGIGPTNAWVKKMSRDLMRGKTTIELMHALP